MKMKSQPSKSHFKSRQQSANAQWMGGLQGGFPHGFRAKPGRSRTQWESPKGGFRAKPRTSGRISVWCNISGFCGGRCDWRT